MKSLILKSKGQGALEILIIMGVLLIVAIIFVLIFVSSIHKSAENDNTDIVQNKMFSDFDSNLNDYEIPIEPGFNFNNQDIIFNVFFSVFLLFFLAKIKPNLALSITNQ